MTEDIDVLILGGGINGAGLFRDLAEQGVKVVLTDKGDFGGGTSAAPSRLIHGGLKYLETGEFRLVAQSTLERNLLLRNAPHAVTPVPSLIPIFSWFKGVPAALRTLFGSTTAPRERGALLIKLGLWLYDLYGARARVMPRHRMFSRKTALAEIPALTPRIVAAGLYYDAKVAMPERLVMELVLDGLTANPAARAHSHAALLGQKAGVVSIFTPDGPRDYRPRLVVNAAGPWIDHVNAALGSPSRMIGGTKGSHILMDHPALLAQLKGRMIYFETDDGRLLLVFEYMGRALVGSTDIRADNPDQVAITDAEIDYFLTALRSLLPGLSFDRSQIVYAYAGIRPLPASDAANPGLISRDHSTPELSPTADRPFAILSLVGGKWTTFRGFAEEVSTAILDRLGHQRRISTRELPIGGGRDFPKDPKAWASAFPDPSRALDLLGRYGTRATAILPDGSAQLPDLPDWSEGEIRWLIRAEMVRHLSDLILRRTSLAVTGRLTRPAFDRIAELTAEALGWDRTTTEAEIAGTRAALSDRHRLRWS